MSIELPRPELLAQAREVFVARAGLAKDASDTAVLRKAATIMSCGTVDKYPGPVSHLLLAAMKEVRR